MSRFTYKGVDLSPFLNVLKIERTVGNNRNVATNDTPKIGVNVQEVTFGAKIIKVKVSLASRDLAPAFVDTIEYPTVSNTNLNKLREKVTSLLHAENEFKLELPDEPDRFYMAIPRGDIELEGISDWYDETTVEFFVPDGVAHSSTYRKFDNGIVSSDKIVFNLINDGNVPAFPVVTIKNNAENGYIGLVNTSGALEIGDREEADTEQYKQSEVLFDYASSNGQDRIPNGFNKGTKNIATTNDPNDPRPTGTLGVDNVWGRPHIALRSGKTASLTWDIPNDSSGAKGALYEYFWWRQIFWAGAFHQQGYMKITVHAENNEFLYGVETWKRSNGLSSEYNFLASNGRGGFNMLSSKRFDCTHIDTQNPFNEPRGWSDIQRFDDVLQFYWWGSYLRFTVPEIKGKKSAKINITFGRVGNADLVTHIYLDQFIYRKDLFNIEG